MVGQSTVRVVRALSSASTVGSKRSTSSPDTRPAISVGVDTLFLCQVITQKIFSVEANAVRPAQGFGFPQHADCFVQLACVVIKNGQQIQAIAQVAHIILFESDLLARSAERD